MTTDYTIALAQTLNDKVAAASTGTARGTVVSIGSNGTVTFSVGSYTTPRQGIYLGPGVPQVGDVIVYFDEGSGFPLVLGATGPRDMSIDATKAFIVGNTRLTTTGLTVNGVSYTPTAWTAATLQNGWVNLSAGFATAAYRKVGDMVQLRGLVRSGTVDANTPILTLPAGSRPPLTEQFITASFNTFAHIYTHTSGAVACEMGSNTSVSLSGIQFSTV